MKPKRFLGRTDTHSIIWCPFFSLLFFFFFLEAKQHVWLYNAQLERYYTGGFCLCCLFSLWGKGLVDAAKCSSEVKHWIQSHANNHPNERSKEAICSFGVETIVFFLFLWVEVLHWEHIPGSTEGQAGPQQTTGPSDQTPPPPRSMMVSQPTDNHRPPACQT